jgi:hypothetical protein
MGQKLALSRRSLSSLIESTATTAAPGRFNALLYSIARAHPNAFRNVVSGSNNLTSSFCAECEATPGFDAVTGLGVPNVSVLLNAL